MAKNESDCDWAWKDRQDKLDPHTSRLFGMQKLIKIPLVLVYMLTPRKISTSEMKSTVGIECTDLTVDDTTVQIWDFAGQLEYTVTHQYFLSAKVKLLSL